MQVCGFNWNCNVIHKIYIMLCYVMLCYCAVYTFYGTTVRYYTTDCLCCWWNRCWCYIAAVVAEVALALRCPASKFITHTLSHMSFLFLLAAATFRLDGATHPIAFNMTSMDTSWPPLVDVDSQLYAELIENVIKSTFRPANILMTNVQICLMFWIFGNPAFTRSVSL